MPASGVASRSLRALAMGLALLASPAAVAQSRVQILRDGVGPTDIEEVVALATGGVIVLGEGPTGTWLAELDASGDLVRQTRLLAPERSRATGMELTPDGGTVVAGWYLDTASGFRYGFLVKLDPAWAIEWQSSWRSNCSPEHLVASPDGSWLVPCGGGLCKLDALGTVLWQKSYGPYSGSQNSLTLAPYSADRWLAAMNLQRGPVPEDELILLELDGDGLPSAARLVNGPEQENIHAIHVLPDGTAYVVTRLWGSVTFDTCGVMQLAADGAPAWIVGATMGRAPWLPGTGVAPDGSLVVAGSMQRPGRGHQAGTFELAPDGTAGRWASLGGVLDEFPECVAYTPQGWVVGGTTTSVDGDTAPRTGWLVRVDATFQLPAACDMNGSDALRLDNLAPTITPTTVTYNTPIVVMAAGAITLAPGELTVKTHCTDAPQPPTEVSPPGAMAPLRVQAGGVMTWEDGALSGSDSFDVHRGLIADLRARGYGACFATSLLGTSTTDPALPGAGSGWFYLVRGRNAAGHGMLGSDSSGVESIPLTPCP